MDETEIAASSFTNWHTTYTAHSWKCGETRPQKGASCTS